MTALADAIHRELRKVGTPERAAGSKAYLKSELAFTGATAAELRAAVKAAGRALPIADRAALFATVEALWSRGVWELQSAAVELLSTHHALLGARDLPAIKRLLERSFTWALVDPLSTDVLGRLLEREPKIAQKVQTTFDAWAKDRDFWVRRAAMLAHLRQLRAGAGDWERFARYADAMLDEREFFIRKAIGWVLRETSKKRPALVAEWLEPRMHRASGVTTREALKYLPAAAQKRLTALSARRSAGSASGSRAASAASTARARVRTR